MIEIISAPFVPFAGKMSCTKMRETQERTKCAQMEGKGTALLPSLLRIWGEGSSAVARDDLVGLAQLHVAELDLLFAERLDGSEEFFVRLIRAERVFFAVV